ncbi:MAG TPA: hypothetical protein VK179_09495 [Bacteroidales bacterium]|nr:hypothetical protein [Bacteroidales bacterium]
MKKLIFLPLTILVVMSCTQNNDALKHKALSIATQFALQKTDQGKAFTDSNGVVSVGDSMARFVIDPGRVFSGLADSASKNSQVWITIDSIHEQGLMPDYHLLLESDGDSLKIARVIRSDARILGINEGIITAEVPTHDPSSPLYYCSECRDTVLFKLKGESLILATRR